MRFERVSKYPDAVLPTRATKGSAGYDFTVAEETFCPYNQVTYVPTGIKMQIDEGYELRLSIRSSSPKKYGVVLANGIGVIDSDYYNNTDNEGHIMFAILPFKGDVTFKKGDRIGQGVISKFYLTDDDAAEGTRSGGFGSTNLDGAVFNTDSLN
jgi:dUTP pyrophosphatase